MDQHRFDYTSGPAKPEDCVSSPSKQISKTDILSFGSRPSVERNSEFVFPRVMLLALLIDSEVHRERRYEIFEMWVLPSHSGLLTIICATTSFFEPSGLNVFFSMRESVSEQ